MRVEYLLLGVLLCLLIVDQVSAKCLCAAQGEDYCACTGAIRPIPKSVPRIPGPKFPPIGDNCWCGQQLVQPAIPPKPPCKTAPDCKCSCAPPLPAPSCLDALGPPKLPIGIPADPISISLALRAGKAFAVPEAKLSYGPVGAPLDALKKIYMSQIPEEKMYALNSQIIELKKRLPKKEEIIEEEEEEEAEVDLPQPYLTYQELGYGPAVIKNPLFMRYNHYAPPPPPVKGNPLLGCGFVPGKISQNAKIVDDPVLFGGDCA